MRWFFLEGVLEIYYRLCVFSPPDRLQPEFIIFIRLLVASVKQEAA